MKGVNNPKLLRVQNVFSVGSENCNHDWVYDKPIAMSFSVPAVIVQDRICNCCGRLERIHLEGKQARYDMDKFAELKVNN